jgi:hypothetical protein
MRRRLETALWLLLFVTLGLTLAAFAFWRSLAATPPPVATPHATLDVVLPTAATVLTLEQTTSSVITAPSTVAASPTPINTTPPTLDDFWEGRAMWKVDVFDVGLPFGESDTLVGPDGQLWSYLHASAQSAGVVDQWGEPAPFPGCVTLWKSVDGGRRFQLTEPRCLIACQSQPCSTEAGDHINQQQYPRVMQAEDGVFYMVYEWGGRAYLRVSPDGLNWGPAERVRGTGIWKDFERPCEPHELINPFPLLPDPYACLSGAPPGLWVEGDRMYVFVGMGKSPAHMGCYVGLRAEGARAMQPCSANPLFTGAEVYGRPDTISAEMNPYFDFHIISSADVLKVGRRYYLVYEGMRGTDQFALGLARSAGPEINGPWEKYRGNPILLDLPGNIGVGHGDLIVLDGVTYLYTATSGSTRGRYVLNWK